MRNKWYSGNGAKNPSLKLNISMYSQSLVTEGLTAPTSLNHLGTRPVHIPPHVISFSDKSLWRVWLDASGSFHTHTPFARGQFTDWDVASVSGVRMQPFPDGQMHLVQDPTPPSSLGIGPALTPNLLLLGWGGGERNAEHNPKAAVQDSGDIARESLNRLGMVQKLCHWFSIMGKRKSHSINHDRNMGCLGKWGLSYTKH